MNKYLKGIIGGVIGGLIASIPWVLVYVYGNFIFSLLAAVIGMGVSFGYRKLNGPLDKKTPWIVAIITVLIVVLSNLVVIPIVMAYKELGICNLEIFKWMYSVSEVRAGIIGDFVISMLFAILGVSGIFMELRKEVGAEKVVENANPYTPIMNDIIDIFKKNNAINTINAIPISKFPKYKKEEDYKLVFDDMIKQNSIRKIDNKYYFIAPKNNKYLILMYVLLGLVLLLGIIFN